MLARELIRLVSYLPTGAYITQKITFEISDDAALARLQIITEDKYGRIQAQAAEHLLLLSRGDAQLNIPDAPEARCVISSPGGNAEAHGGTLPFRGEFVPFNETPLLIELLDEDGTSLAQGKVILSEEARQPFSGTVSYEVESPVHALLTVRQEDDRIPGVMRLCSRPVTLYP